MSHRPRIIRPWEPAPQMESDSDDDFSEEAIESAGISDEEEEAPPRIRSTRNRSDSEASDEGNQSQLARRLRDSAADHYDSDESESDSMSEEVKPNPRVDRCAKPVPKIRKITDNGNLDPSELKLWNVYIQSHPELDLAYSVFIDPDEDSAPNLNPPHVDRRLIPIIIHPNSPFGVTFSDWLKSSNGLDFGVAYIKELSELIIGYYEDNISRSRRIEQLQRVILTKGAIFLLEPALAKRINRTLSEVEQIRQRLVRYLPAIELVTTYPLSKETSDSDSDTGTPDEDSRVTILFRYIESYQLHEFGTQSIQTNIPTKLEVEYTTLKVIKDYFPYVKQKFFNGIDFEKESTFNRDNFTLRSRFLSDLFYESDLSTTEIRRIEYEIDSVEGDFNLPSQEGINVLAGSTQMRASCEVIRTAFISPVGNNRDRALKKTYNTSTYSQAALIQFVRGIYDQKLTLPIDLDVLFEIYDLFIELGCLNMGFGSLLNQELGNHLNELADPLVDVSELLNRLPQGTQFDQFRKELSWFKQQLGSRYNFTEADYEKFVKSNIRQFKRQRQLRTRSSTVSSEKIILNREADFDNFTEDSEQTPLLYGVDREAFIDQFYRDLGMRLPEILKRLYQLSVRKLAMKRDHNKISYTIDFI